MTVLLAEMSRRKSQKTGQTYFAGFCGKANVLLFKTDRTDKFGNEVWELKMAEPQKRDGSGERPAPRQSSDSQAPLARDDVRDDEIPF